VTAIVRLLRAAMKGLGDGMEAERALVFQDVDGIATGELWDEAVDRAIGAAHKVFLFWCEHASTSREVLRECRIARRLRKPLLPVLLDETPLPPAMAKVQGVDLRDLGFHGEHFRDLVTTPGERPLEVKVVERFAETLGLPADPLLRAIARP
jgi:hypothetical protein